MVDIQAKSIKDLPENMAMTITMEIAKRVILSNGEKVTPRKMMLR